MPIYDYECTQCGRVYDELRKSENSQNSRCVDCGGLANKIFSTPNIGKSRGESVNNSDIKKCCPYCHSDKPHDILIGISIPVPILIQKPSSIPKPSRN
jgi:putative FmdB family regulatory protein